MITRRKLGISVSLLLVSLPQLPAALSGCNNGYLLGTYNAQVSNLNLQSLLQAANGSAPAVTPPATSPPAVVGFGSNPRSLSGSMPGASRFFFDGNGNIVGQTAITGGGTTSTAVGTYSVALDCTATMTLSGGATFDAVVAGAGSTVLFLETDSSGNASIGSLRRSASCVSLSYPQSFGFSFSG